MGPCGKGWADSARPADSATTAAAAGAATSGGSTSFAIPVPVSLMFVENGTKLSHVGDRTRSS